MIRLFVWFATALNLYYAVTKYGPHMYAFLRNMNFYYINKLLFPFLILVSITGIILGITRMYTSWLLKLKHYQDNKGNYNLFHCVVYFIYLMAINLLVILLQFTNVQFIILIIIILVCLLHISIEWYSFIKLDKENFPYPLNGIDSLKWGFIPLKWFFLHNNLISWIILRTLSKLSFLVAYINIVAFVSLVRNFRYIICLVWQELSEKGYLNNIALTFQDLSIKGMSTFIEALVQHMEYIGKYNVLTETFFHVILYKADFLYNFNLFIVYSFQYTWLILLFVSIYFINNTIL